MEHATFKINVSESIGAVSAIITPPDNTWCTLTLAHGAGAGMTHPFMTSLALALASHGVRVLRFNFPFVEGKKKRPDFAPVAEKTVEAVIDYALQLVPAHPLFVAGKSFGGRMSSQFLAKQERSGIKGLVFFGFPLHPMNDPGVKRAEHLLAIKVPMLFLQGTKDALARTDLIADVTAGLSTAELQTFEGSDHAFMRGKKTFIPELAEATVDWLKRQCNKN